MSSSGNQIDQGQLVAQLKSKDPEGFDFLYKNYSGAIFGIISRIVTDGEVAEEVLQDAFLKIYDKIGQFDAEKGRLFTWMANLSRNLAIDRLRSKEMKKAGKTNSLANYVSDIERSNVYHPSIDAIGLKENIDKLREEERLILDLVYFKGYTQSEITKEYDIPIGTVKTRLRMAMKSLRTVLGVT